VKRSAKLLLKSVPIFRGWRNVLAKVGGFGFAKYCAGKNGPQELVWEVSRTMIFSPLTGVRTVSGASSTNSIEIGVHHQERLEGRVELNLRPAPS
jgi:hypothetical protein